MECTASTLARVSRVTLIFKEPGTAALDGLRCAADLRWSGSAVVRLGARMIWLLSLGSSARGSFLVGAVTQSDKRS
jgi:hypothetical protein